MINLIILNIYKIYIFINLHLFTYIYSDFSDRKEVNLMLDRPCTTLPTATWT